MFRTTQMKYATLITAVAYLAISGRVCAGADPFYYSTWFAPPNPALAWSGASVMPGYSYDRMYSTSGPADFDSPLFFRPGYGYVGPMSPFRSPLRFYDQGYAYGSLRYGTMPGSFTNPSEGIGGYSAMGIQNRFGGITPTGMLHAPWYLPGSPGNDREFLFRW